MELLRCVNYVIRYMLLSCGDVSSRAMAAGFMSHHAKLDGLWGCGTYYSTLPRLAMDYQHSVGSADMGMRNGLHSFDSCEGLKQMLAVDVLTGKAKELAEDRSLRIAPEIEGT